MTRDDTTRQTLSNAFESSCSFTAEPTCLAAILCDDHAEDDSALRLIGADLSVNDVTYGELRERSERCAAALAELGVGPGDRVATLMGKSADLITVLLAVWRCGAIHVPLFTAFAAPAIELRLRSSASKLIVADADQAAKLDTIDASCGVITLPIQAGRTASASESWPLSPPAAA